MTNESTNDGKTVCTCQIVSPSRLCSIIVWLWPTNRKLHKRRILQCGNQNRILQGQWSLSSSLVWWALGWDDLERSLTRSVQFLISPFLFQQLLQKWEVKVKSRPLEESEIIHVTVTKVEVPQSSAEWIWMPLTLMWWNVYTSAWPLYARVWLKWTNHKHTSSPGVW